MKDMDDHFLTEKDFRNNIPAMLGLIDFYHINIQGLPVKALVPYSEPLKYFVGHISQLEMESNGKLVQRDPTSLEALFSATPDRTASIRSSNWYIREDQCLSNLSLLCQALTTASSLRT
jgi:hypothetical protein